MVKLTTLVAFLPSFADASSPWGNLFAHQHPRAVEPIRGPSVALWSNSEELFPSSVFNVAGSPGMIKKVLTPLPVKFAYSIPGTIWQVRYQAFCEPWHYLLAYESQLDRNREVRALERMNEIDRNLAPLLILESEEIAAPDPFWGRGKIPREALSTLSCSKPLRMVKYMITERIERTLHDILVEYKKLPLHLVAHVGLQVLTKLRKIHDGGLFLMRSDLHSIGIVMGRSELAFVNFKEARTRLDIELRDDWIPPLISLWDWRLRSMGYSDDVFDLVQILAVLTHGLEFLDDVRNFGREARGITRSFSEWTLGGRVYSLDDDVGIVRGHAEGLKQTLDALVVVAGKSIGTEAKPDYNIVADLLVKISITPSVPEIREQYGSLYGILGIALPE